MIKFTEIMKMGVNSVKTVTRRKKVSYKYREQCNCKNS